MSARVLCIDDDELNRSLLADVCELSGFAVTLAADPEEGLQTWKRDRPDVVLLDLMMPGRSGMELLEQLGDSPDSGRSAVLMVSAVSTAVLQHQAFALGALDWVMKPFHVSDLQARIQLAVDLLAAARGAPVGDARLGEGAVAAAMLGDRRVEAPPELEVLLARGPDAQAAFGLARALRAAGGPGVALLAAQAGEVVAVWAPAPGLGDRLATSLSNVPGTASVGRGRAPLAGVAAEVARLRGA